MRPDTSRWPIPLADPAGRSRWPTPSVAGAKLENTCQILRLLGIATRAFMHKRYQAAYAYDLVRSLTAN
jgi:hypothetical protein